MGRLSNAELLSRFIEHSGLSMEQAAKELLVKRPTLFAWLAGQKQPKAVHRRIIARWTKGAVPEDGWPAAKREDALVDTVKPFARAVGANG